MSRTEKNFSIKNSTKHLSGKSLDFIISMRNDIVKTKIEYYWRSQHLNMKSRFSFVEISIDWSSINESTENNTGKRG